MSPDVGFGLVLGITLVIAVAGIITGIAARYWCLLVGTSLFLAVMMTLLLGFAAWDWHHLVENGCIVARECYCELQSPVTGLVPLGKIRQPGATLSAFAPALAGLFILGELDVRSDRARGSRSGVLNPMQLPSTTSVLFGMVAVLLGPGSMIFHMSLKEVPGLFDPISIIVFATFVFSYSLWRSFECVRRDEAKFYWLFFATWLVAAGVLIGLAVGGFTNPASIAAIVLAIGWELFGRLIPDSVQAAKGQPSFYRTGRNLIFGWTALGAFGTAFIFWILSQTGGPLCMDPSSSVLQGHNLWHIGAMGVAPYLIFRYFYSERTQGPASLLGRPY